jgi:hypothetical protein
VVIYDHVDRDVPVLARMAAKRAVGYSAISYTIAQRPGLFDGHQVEDYSKRAIFNVIDPASEGWPERFWAPHDMDR